MGTNFIRAMLLASASVTAAVGVAPTAAHAQEQRYDVNIPAQPLADAIRALGRSTRQTIVFDGAIVRGKRSVAVRGNMAPAEALDRMLSGSGLVIAKGASGSLTVRMGNGQEGADLASSNGGLAVGGMPDGDNADSEIVVTGTHIRGVEGVGTQVQDYDREHIDRSGFGTLQQFLQSLPQNLNKGAVDLGPGPYTQGGPVDNYGDTTYGSGVNLRGLGQDSTLVLLNGRRLPPSGYGNYVDISMFPVSAIERVQVLPDGASAIYGSDAIGGVVNIALRRNLDGVETRLRIGTAHGGAEELQASQALGVNWNSGSILATYDYYDRKELLSRKRDFISNVSPDSFLVTPQTRHTGLLTATQQIGEAAEISATGLYSRRTFLDQSSGFDGSSFQITPFEGRNTQLGGALGVKVDLWNDWQANLEGGLGGTHSISEGPFFTTENRNSLATIEGRIDGTLLFIPGGPVKLAAGTHYRREQSKDISASTSNKRDLFALFGELYVPLVGEHNARLGLRRLELSAAARYENYSDFGTALNPRFGLSWWPVDGFKLRGSYGKSFRAPTLFELNPQGSGTLGIYWTLPDSVGTPVPALYLLGANPDLRPEKSTNWSIGLDVEPAQIPGLQLSASYYSIAFKGRITPGLAGVSPFSAIPEAANTAPGVVTLNPTPTQISTAIANSGTFFNYFELFPEFYPGGFTLDQATAIVDDRLRNISKTNTSGLDITGSYKFDLGSGSLSVNANGNYTFKFENILVPGGPASSLLNRVYNPVGFKARVGMAFDSGQGIIAAANANYVDSYKNDLVTPIEKIRSWTTVDISLSYKIAADRELGALQGTTFQLSVTNLFDQDPPFVSWPSQFGDAVGVYNFDGANANGLGRYVSFQITKAW